MGFSTMYVGATGVTAYSIKMQVIGNNLANVNTVGYRKADLQFGELCSQSIPGGMTTSDGTGIPSQVGKGVGISQIRNIFLQGNMAAGQANTDIAVSGKGMFRVVDHRTNAQYYTRTGNFRFDHNGYLVGSHGYVLQGFPIDPQTGNRGTVGDIRLVRTPITINGVTTQAVLSEATATTSLSLNVNLAPTTDDRSTRAGDPFFALAGLWDGTSNPPLSASSFSYSSPIKAYDSEGTPHVLTVYFDKVTTSNASGKTYWEYVVGIDPREDGGEFSGTSGAGMLMMGTLTFNSSGQLIGQTAFTYNGGADGGPKNLSNWSPASFNAQGVPVVEAQFLPSTATSSPAAQIIAFDVGLHSTDNAWTNLGSNTTASGVGASSANLPELSGMIKSALASTGYNTGNYTSSQTQNGCAVGVLNSIEIDSAGIVRGYFTNGKTQDLYQVSLYNFQNEFGLKREGACLFATTPESGTTYEGCPTTSNFGEIEGRMLEMSNADMTYEFVEMILTQRGFQANTKVITTADSLLNTLINIKR